MADGLGFNGERVLKFSDIKSIRIINTRSDTVKMTDTERWSLEHTHQIELNVHNNNHVLIKSSLNRSKKRVLALENVLEETQGLLATTQASLTSAEKKIEQLKRLIDTYAAFYAPAFLGPFIRLLHIREARPEYWA